MALIPSRRYSARQREALAAIYSRPGVSARRAVELSAAGELEHPSGAMLGPFDTTESTVRSVARRARMRQEREAAVARTSDLPPRDGVERLRCRLVDAIDVELDRIEIEQAEGRPLACDSLRQLGRAIWELAAIPGPLGPRPPAPGVKVNGVRRGGETRGGLAGKILTDHHGGAGASAQHDARASLGTHLLPT